LRALEWNVINKRIKECEQQYESPLDIIKCLNRLIDVYGRDGMILYRIGVWYENLRMYDKAMEYYREAIEKFPLPKYRRLAEESYRRVKHIVEGKPSVSKEISTLIIDDDTLFVVNCTKTKTWNLAKSLGCKVPKQLPAMLAYQGKSFHEFLALIREIEKSIGKRVHWVILSAKYGFLTPCDIIMDYDVTFGQKGSISDDELAEQVNYKEIGGRKLSTFKRIYVYTKNPQYYRKACNAFKNATECIQLSTLHPSLIISTKHST